MLRGQLFDASDGHKNTQATIVFAAVAHGVEVTASHQVFGARSGRVITSHHIAHGIDVDLVKACRFHGLLNAGTASHVRLCEVGHSELAVFFEAWIAVLRQGFVPIPHFVALCRMAAGFVVEANFYDAVNVAQTLR